jgi:hypothetical protein
MSHYFETHFSHQLSYPYPLHNPATATKKHAYIFLDCCSAPSSHRAPSFLLPPVVHPAAGAQECRSGGGCVARSESGATVDDGAQPQPLGSRWRFHHQPQPARREAAAAAHRVGSKADQASLGTMGQGAQPRPPRHHRHARMEASGGRCSAAKPEADQ